MTKPFEINFDFPVALSDLKISLKATAELHHSDPYFVVHDFYLANNFKNKAHHHSILPDQEVKRIQRGQDFSWVHRDSGRESLLSLAIGAALEENMSADELAGITATN
jgi:hypothetical protein